MERLDYEYRIGHIFIIGFLLLYDLHVLDVCLKSFVNYRREMYTMDYWRIRRVLL